MPKKGTVNNPNGRPKGSPNKSTDELRSLLQEFINANMETLQADFDKLEPKDRLNYIDRLLKHVLPAPLHEGLTDEKFIVDIKPITWVQTEHDTDKV
ncbi:MAG: hypothetical protein K0B15_08975 [Lentimicrobium sp.]|nr:hypothetical protein [Lentimicrobium sp.]